MRVSGTFGDRTVGLLARCSLERAAVSVSTGACRVDAAAGSYARRTPEQSVLYLVVREHLETFLTMVREERGKDLPHYVEQELRRFLRCGVLAHGFLRVACLECGEEIIVAFSCKCRGACPSCSARRMCGTAAHLVDRVMPVDVAVRQWVLTVPHEVRRLLALRPAALTGCGRIFVEELARWQKQAAKARGIDGGETGAVTFVQRFNSMLGCFVHFHLVVPDGVFTRTSKDAAAATFHRGPAPSRQDIAAVAARVELRMTRWLRRRGFVDERPEEERSNETAEPSPLEVCMQLSLFGGTFLCLDDDGTPVPVASPRARAGNNSPWAAETGGFNVHAGVTVDATDREGLERLLRYGARPAFSSERLSLLPDGRVAYLLRRPRSNGATHLVLDPIVFLARIASLNGTAVRTWTSMRFISSSCSSRYASAMLRIRPRRSFRLRTCSESTSTSLKRPRKTFSIIRCRASAPTVGFDRNASNSG